MACPQSPPKAAWRLRFPPHSKASLGFPGVPLSTDARDDALASADFTANLRAPMSTALPDRPQPLAGARRFVIVASRYNAEFVDGLIAGARGEFAAIAPGSSVEVFRVPGSFEIPLGVQTVGEQGKADAILAFGLLWEGETSHADLIATAVTNALLSLSLRLKLPVLHEIIVAHTEEQARERCLGTKINRGTEAARAAVRMLQALDAIRGSHGDLRHTQVTAEDLAAIAANRDPSRTPQPKSS